MENNFKANKKHEGRIFAGLILVGVGAALLLRNSGFPLPYWLFSWPIILILVGIYSGVKHSFKNNTWIIFMCVGGFFLVDKFMPELRLAPNFWPVIIIGVGVLFILRPDRNRWMQNGCMGDEKKSDKGFSTGSSWEHEANSNNFTTDSSDFIKVSSVFSGIERNIVSKNFQGGKISCVFGGVDIDLTQADIQGKKEIRFEVIFGGAKLIVPPNWTVYNQLDGVFHGVEDKRKYTATAETSTEKVLVLKGSVIFGGVEIRSY